MKLAWFISNHCGLLDPVFGHHPLTSDMDVIQHWHNYSFKANILPLFRNLKYLYLVLGSVIQLFQDSNAFTSFKNEFFTNDEKIFTRKPFACPSSDCSFTTSNFFGMFIHFLKHSHHNYGCPICFQSFTSLEMLTDHQQIHQNGEYSCWICQGTFESAETLTAHFNFHAIGRLYLCNNCGRIFSTKGMLNIHFRSHTGDRPFTCEICSKQFVSANALSLHNRIHSREKPFVCDVCGQKFAQQITLSNHQRIHTGERPYQCEYCGKSFKQNGALIAHLRISYRRKTVSICRKVYHRQDHLTRHKKSAHSNP